MDSGQYTFAARWEYRTEWPSITATFSLCGVPLSWNNGRRKREQPGAIISWATSAARGHFYPPFSLPFSLFYSARICR